MDCNKNDLPPRQPVLVVTDGDGYLEIFAEKNLDVRIERLPVAHAHAAEVIAEDYLEATLPRRYRELYWPGKRRATAVVRPLRPLTIDAANRAERTMRDLDQLLDSLNTDDQHEEDIIAWTL
ncbi:MAG: hypothetical protein RH917_14545 [Lacipirellulaceae bacterium]